MVKINATIELNVNALEAGTIVAQVLKDDYVFISKDIQELRSKGSDISDVELQDLLENNLNVRGAMTELLAYYLTHIEFEAFMEEQRAKFNG